MGLLVILKVQPISYENSSCDMGTFEIWSNKARKKKNKKNTFGYLRLSEGYEYPTLYDRQFTRYGKSSNFVIIKLLCSFKPGRSLNFSVVKRGTNSKGVFI